MAEPDPERLKRYSFLVFSKLEGAITSGMIHLGDRLGLYRILADADEPLTSAELAERAGLDERWIREWTYNQAAARILVADLDGEERFSLSAEGVAVLADPEHPSFGLGMFHKLPQTMETLRVLPESFRTGVGFDYDAQGAEGAAGLERSFEPWNRVHLLPDVVPQLEGVEERLRVGGAVADIGCGPGGAVLMFAAAFPGSRVTGYDISHFALDRARERLAESGLTNARFVDPREEPLPEDHSVDLVTTLDCIHDMTDPQGMMRAIRAAIADDGTWLLVDIKGRDSFAENVEKNPMASMMYGISIMSCMSSALSEPGGAGLGTLGLPASKARAMAAAAGFGRFRKLDVDHPVNAFYEIRP